MIIKPRALLEARERINEKLNEKQRELERRLPGMGVALASVSGTDLEVEDTLPGIGVALAKVPERVAEKMREVLSRNPHIEFVEADRPLALADTVANDTYYSNAWHLDKVNAPMAWDYSLGAQVTVAVLDTGINANHPDLKGKVLSGWNTVSNSSSVSDVNGHGTQVAGVVGAISNNGTGVTSIAWKTRIMPVRVSNQSTGVAYVSDIAEGLIWAADHGADVANISYGITHSQTIQDAARYMNDRNGVVVAAAGNSGTRNNYNDSPYVITVSATESSDNITSWSSYGDYVDVAAPGAGLYTTTRDGGYARVSGTSFSSPLTAGVVALMRAMNPALTPRELELALEGSALDLGSSGFDSYYGHGRIDAMAAVMAAQTGASPDPEPTPEPEPEPAPEPGIDSTSPQVSFVSPTKGADVSGRVTVKIDATDNVAVNKAVLFVNGRKHSVDNAEPFSFSWDTTAAADGNTGLKVRVFDASGNSAQKWIEVKVNNVQAASPEPDADPEPSPEEPVLDDTPPQMTFISPSEGNSVAGQVTVKVGATDNVQVRKAVLFVNGVKLGEDTSAPYTFNWDTTQTGEGSASVKVRVFDTSGNTNQERIETIVDNA
ncbi:S8 family serine peptidase [Thiohalobacter thiocyanaticus]|uniref:S8 family serine peptidase n=1 Tax=Thiohalobacter thiocyanaticus TaxID=585455 RepID=UPI00131A2361|nr:S8 family serine peptidase [Thiohalobacter thiocyanaticus]